MSSPNKISYEAPGKFQESRFEKIHSITFESAQKGSKLVAQEIAEAITSNKKNPFVLGLATGSSPIGVYRELVRIHKTKKLSFKNVVTFNLDEYFNIDSEHPQSYHTFMNTHLFSHIDIPRIISIYQVVKLRRRMSLNTVKTSRKK